MKRREQLVPFPLGATLLFWAGLAYTVYTVVNKFPQLVVELRRLF